MSYKRVRWILASEVVLVVALVVLAFAWPEARVFITPIIVVAALVQTLVLTRKRRGGRR